MDSILNFIPSKLYCTGCSLVPTLHFCFTLHVSMRSSELLGHRDMSLMNWQMPWGKQIPEILFFSMFFTPLYNFVFP